MAQAQQPEQYFEIKQFKGLSSPFVFSGDPSKTRFATNIKSSFGRLILRDGYEELGTASTEDSGSNVIVGLINFNKSNNTSQLLRVRVGNNVDVNDKGVDLYSPTTDTWSAENDVLNQVALESTDYISSVTHADNLYINLPDEASLLKWSGTNLTAHIAIVARLVASFAGYGLLGYAAGGTTTSLTIRYDAANQFATLPAGNVLNTFESQGPLVNMLPLGKMLVAYKTEGASVIKFVGSSTVTFSQERGQMSLGLLAPGSLQDIPGVGHIGMFSDGQLYINDGNFLQPVLYDLNNTLGQLLNPEWAHQSYGTVNPYDATYSLFFASGDNEVLNKRLDFNYRTGEFTVLSYSTGFTRAIYSGYASTANNPALGLVTSHGTRVFHADSGLTDDGEAIDYAYQTDWLDMGSHQVKSLNRFELLCDPSSTGEIEFAVATDFDQTWRDVKRVTINTVHGQPDVIVRYNMSNPPQGRLFNVRLRFFPREAASDIVVKGGGFYWTVVGKGPHEMDGYAGRGN